MVDGPGASWQIQFSRPLANLRTTHSVSFTVFEDQPIAQAPPSSWPQRLEALLRDLEPTVVVLSRCHGVLLEPIVQAAKNANIPTIYHIDDDLLSVPEELGEAKFQFYNDPARRNRILTALKSVDLIYCSTAALHHRLGRLGLETSSVYGAIFSAAIPPFKPFSPKAPLTVGYMGTSGHKADLELVVPAVTALMRERPDIHFEVFGSLKLPDALRVEFPDRTSHIPPDANYEQFLTQLSRLGWAVGLAPLKLTPFNAVKSNTKFVEYSVAGMPVIASAGPAYDSDVQSGCALGCRNSGDWRAAMMRVTGSSKTAEGLVAKAQKRLVSEYNISRLSSQVIHVIQCASRVHAQRSGRAGGSV